MSGDKKLDKKPDMDELAKAFDSAKKVGEDKPEGKKKKSGKSKKSIAFFTIGMLALVGGLSFLIYRLVVGPSAADAEFLINAGEWVEEDEPSVVWKFTEVGKGTLTTDGHTTDYDFIWALENGKIKVETAWLYKLEDTFNYSLDQGAKVLTLKDEEKGVEVKLKANN
ncbi:hypothetical protein IKG07_01740 [Candidatus Saccharibacteria bacterium]|nr:hypothetical protein [Candidatus Saccharibacteria bacterium]